MKHPESVIAKTKEGKEELRNLLHKGTFIIYNYLNPESGKVLKDGKKKLVLKGSEGAEEYFIVPLDDKKSLLINVKEKEETKSVWDGKNKKAVNI